MRFLTIILSLFYITAFAEFTLGEFKKIEDPVVFFYDPEVTPEEFKKTKELAEKGDAHAQHMVGYCYYMGSGVSKDKVEAVKWYRKAAEQGLAQPQYALGYCYHNGYVVAKDLVEAYGYYNLAALTMQSARRKRDELESLLSSSQIEAGVKRSREIHALIEARLADKINAKRFAKQKQRAEKGDATEQCNLGWCYYEGYEVLKDLIEAAKWFRRSAEQGNDTAQCNLGVCYYNGEGVLKDLIEAAKWFRRSAEQGNATAQYNLGVCYYNGEGVLKDLIEAAKWYRKAVEEGLPPEVTPGELKKTVLRASYICEVPSGIYEELGRTPNELSKNEELKKVFAQTKELAEKGDAQAQCELGWCYVYGKGVLKDHVEAVKWFKNSAEQGDANGQSALADCYSFGSGVIKDQAEAVKWYLKSAEQGHGVAQMHLAEHYHYGKGVTKDPVEAYAYINLAIITTEWARRYYTIFERNMTPAQIDAGQKRAKELQAEIEAKKTKTEKK
jgi:TPR repeat protein